MRFSEYLKKVSGDFHVAIKVEWLNYDETVLYEFTNDICDINASVSVNYNQGARRSCTLLLNNDNNKFPINFNGLWIGQKFKLWMGIYFDDETPYLLPQGVFFVSNPDEAYNPSERTVTINGVDKWAWLDGTLNGVLTGTHKTPVGANLYDATKGLLSQPVTFKYEDVYINDYRYAIESCPSDCDYIISWNGASYKPKESYQNSSSGIQWKVKYGGVFKFDYTYSTYVTSSNSIRSSVTIYVNGVEKWTSGYSKKGTKSFSTHCQQGDIVKVRLHRSNYANATGDVSIYNVRVQVYNAYDATPPLLSPSFLTKTTVVNEEEVSVYKCPYTVVTERGKTIADVLLEYATILCANVYYDVHGRLVLEPMIDTADDLTDTNKEIDWHYTVDEKTFLGLRQSYNFTNVYNDILVLGNVANGYQFKGRVQNNNPLSDTSISKIGLKSKPPIEDNQYISDAQCVELAKYYAKMDTIMQKSGTIDSTLLFHLDVNHIVTVSTLNNNMSKEMFLITGFNLSSQGKMSINVTSINVLKDFSVVEVV
jgi:hypothetical protein